MSRRVDPGQPHAATPAVLAGFEIADGAVDAYWKLAEDLWSKYTNLF